MSVAAEQSVLGAILSAGSYDVDAGHRLVDRVVETGLLPEHFWIESLGKLYAAIVEQRLAGRPVDPVSMAVALRAGETEATVLGRLEVLARTVTAFSPAPHWARLVMTQPQEEIAA